MLFFNVFSAKDPHLNAVENVFPTVIRGRNTLQMHLNKWHVLRQKGDPARKPDVF